MIEHTIHGVPPLIIGFLSGYYYGLSLVQQGKALTFSQPYIPLLRIIAFSGAALYFLQWGIIPFILFGGSLITTLWIVILTKTR